MAGDRTLLLPSEFVSSLTFKEKRLTLITNSVLNLQDFTKHLKEIVMSKLGLGPWKLSAL